ncbi:hypothetical protein JTB14_033226 [Gonioctena quinquepunctata]|nr:hypothetical protein JTB14_033226 [Gonioctena quinquepunctata]
MRGSRVDRKHFATPNAIVDSGTDSDAWYTKHVNTEQNERISGTRFWMGISLEVAIDKYEVGNDSSFIKIPDQISKKKVYVIIQNSDQMCVYWSVVSDLYPARRDGQRTPSYPHNKTVLKVEDTPMSLHRIGKFE